MRWLLVCPFAGPREGPPVDRTSSLSDSEAVRERAFLCWNNGGAGDVEVSKPMVVPRLSRWFSRPLTARNKVSLT